jgi:hypothetical protein
MEIDYKSICNKIQVILNLHKTARKGHGSILSAGKALEFIASYLEQPLAGDRNQ